MLRNITIFDAQEIQSISNLELGYDVDLDIVKKQIEKLKRQMNRANERRNFSGENHSRNHKGNR